MRRADRLFQLVHHLRARRFATGEQLASELGVSRRTVYRDIRDLEASGVPIQGEAGVGYRLDRSFELPALAFNAEEIEGLVLGVRMVSTWGDAELAAAVRSAMTKIESALPEPLHRVLIETPLFAAERPDGAAETDSASMTTLRRAIGEKRRTRFAYTRADGRSSERTVRPLGLYFWGTKWTLASWCELRSDYRSFRPDRMKEVRMEGEPFDESDGITLAAFLERTSEEARPGPGGHPDAR